jgi:DNA polymerase-3 subunit epsilon
MRIISLDTETTGFSPKNGDKIVEVAAVLFENGKEIDRFHSLIWPQRSVPERAKAVHGLGAKELRGQPIFKSIAQDLALFLERAEGWAHNASFDNRFLEAEFEEAGIPFKRPMNCSLKLAKSLIKEGPHTLKVLAEKSGWVWKGRGAHSAIEDTLALGHIFQYLQNIKNKSTNDVPVTLKAAPVTQNIYTPRDIQSDAACDPRLLEEIPEFEMKKRGAKWTEHEEVFLKSLWVSGNGLSSICPQMGRTPKAISMRLVKLNLITAHPYGG